MCCSFFFLPGIEVQEACGERRLHPARDHEEAGGEGQEDAPGAGGRGQGEEAGEEQTETSVSRHSSAQCRFLIRNECVAHMAHGNNYNTSLFSDPPVKYGYEYLKKHYIMTKSELINMTLIEIKKINDLLLSIQFNKEKTKLIKQINE